MAGKAQSDQVLEAQYRQLVEQVPAIAYMAERGAEGRWTTLALRSSISSAYPGRVDV